MSAMLRCPNPDCQEIISVSSGSCRYCSLPLDPITAQAEAAKLERATSAVAAANTIRTGNVSVLLVIVAVGLLMFEVELGPWRFLLNAFPISYLAVVCGWFIFHGRLKTDEPDYKPARRAMRKSLALWVVASIIYGLAYAYDLSRESRSHVSRARHNSGMHQTANSVAFKREACFNSAVLRGA
jgi:hypothetical protein